MSALACTVNEEFFPRRRFLLLLDDDPRPTNDDDGAKNDDEADASEADIFAMTFRFWRFPNRQRTSSNFQNIFQSCVHEKEEREKMRKQK
jgi:hypothetical protein|tara:strand:+ start:3236 stop:3505 length:270 start_codon:yes stop_codon:yes gene_type:complete